jgi:hypothetical protein
MPEVEQGMEQLPGAGAESNGNQAQQTDSNPSFDATQAVEAPSSPPEPRSHASYDAPQESSPAPQSPREPAPERDHASPADFPRAVEADFGRSAESDGWSPPPQRSFDDAPPEPRTDQRAESSERPSSDEPVSAPSDERQTG